MSREQKKIKLKKYDGKNTIIFCFHDIDGEGKYSITSDEFTGILDLLRGKYEVYSLKDWYEKVQSGYTFQRPPVVLTFDDGYESIFSIVIPELKRYSFGATFFIYLERYADSSIAYTEIAALPDIFEIGSHSLTHADMEKLYKNNLNTFYKEIFLSRKKLEYLVGKPVISWAWPYGYYNKDLLLMAKRAGYEIQVNTDYKTTNDEFSESTFSRYTVQNPDPVDQVKEILAKNHLYR
ncbi:MAG: polysaccharide deacetylase family protein [Spirochaetia bacterium]|nr:polysaccharide deacetylase family protein [Spirochaetia bacterium]